MITHRYTLRYIIRQCRALFLAGLVLGASPEALLGQYEIQDITVSGNDVLSSNQISNVFMTKETPGFFGKFLYKSISEALGRKDEFFDPVVFADDIGRLERLYQDHGFFEATIDTSFDISEEDNAIRIRVDISEGYRSLIDTLTYRGIEGLPDYVYRDMESGQKIASGDPYNQFLLKGQVDLVLSILKNAGFPNARLVSDSSYARRLASSRNFSIRLFFDTGNIYVFGPIAILREGDQQREDINDEVILKQLDYKPDAVYNQSDVVASERNLNRLGVFDLARIQVSIPAHEDTSRSIPSRITVRPSDKHELSPELLLSDENGNFNIGTGIGYKNRNFLGGARTFSTRLRFRTQTIGMFPDYFNINTDAVSNIDLTFELLQPYIFSNKIRGSWAFSLILDKQRPYRQFIMRNKFGITDQFAEYTFGYFDWTLERIVLERNQVFLVNATPEEIRDLTAQEQRAQFNSIFAFTIQRNKSNDLFSPSGGFIHSATIEESGLLPLALKKAQPDLPFTQFYRFMVLGRWYHDLSNEQRFSVLGMKLKGGFEEKYGESRSDPGRAIPQTHRFYAGGGGSIRGWQSRKLIATGDPNLELGGNLALEGSVELRVNVFQKMRDGFLDKIWTVFFFDAGNVWSEVSDLRLRDVAIATGIGFRYDTFFGPFRIDYGFKVYDPIPEQGRKKWIVQRKFFGETLSDAVLHFGIGHAF